MQLLNKATFSDLAPALTHYSLQATDSARVNWGQLVRARSGQRRAGSQDIQSRWGRHAVKSVTLAIAFDTVASFQPTGDLDDGARSEEKKNSRFPRLLEERSTLAGLRACQSIHVMRFVQDAFPNFGNPPPLVFREHERRWIWSRCVAER